ncbi:MAG TPA: HDIG domain-containing protein, partial [Polyangiaceae bacterium]|nr:HDIG domain-containing protein [Polyangiaceae bacterium]
GAGNPSPEWTAHADKLAELLRRNPILDNPTFQVEQTSSNPELELRADDKTPGTLVRKGVELNAESPALADKMRSLAAAAGFRGDALDVVAARLAYQPRATYSFDAQATTARQDQAAAKVEPKSVVFRAKDVIFRRGDILTASQLNVYRQALEQQRVSAGLFETWMIRLGIIGLVTAVALALAGYTLLFVPKVRRNPMRLFAIASLMGSTVVLACYFTATQPGLIALTSVIPTVFVAVILCVAYDQRVALAYASLHGILVAAALDLPIGTFAVMIMGIGVAVWRLKEVRDRDALIKMGIYEGLTLAGGTFMAALIHLPISHAALTQAAWDSGLAGFGGLLVSGVTLFILPLLEKTFGITTGMTLVELRDPKQPLLRQLQQRAPGTYNHSLNLASLAEAAAEAIGANGLLAYVGALYHDIGKMNKPDYFVENQVPGFNRHDKLSPAMSLLVIVGHVKDGMELAREFNLPRPLWHFIESHHGTTLVEYFYHRARRQAELATSAAAKLAVAGSAGGIGMLANASNPPPATTAIEPTPVPNEMEYRYPGPKPRSREAAIIMLCDAVESAARAMADPTPSRIDATVRAIATKRLMDGQFDECDITLRELNTIVEAVSKALASIYHGRIAYPTLSQNATAPQPGQPIMGPARNVSALATPLSPDQPGPVIAPEIVKPARRA